MNTNFEVHPTTPGIFPGVKVTLEFSPESFGYPSSETAVNFLSVVMTRTETAIRTLLDELNADHAEIVEQEKAEATASADAALSPESPPSIPPDQG